MSKAKLSYEEVLESSVRTKIFRVLAFLGGALAYWAIYQDPFRWMTPVTLCVGTLFVVFGLTGYKSIR